MLRKRAWLALLLLGCFVAPTGAWAQAKKSSNKTQAVATKPVPKKSTRKRRAPVRRQQAISKDRVKEIQAALIREGYLTGAADGVWGESTKSAMARYQADNGWQSKVVPDSRALIKLGLGPKHAGLLNPESIQQQDNDGAGTSEGTSQ